MALKYPILDELYEFAAEAGIDAGQMRQAISNLIVPPGNAYASSRFRVIKVLKGDEYAELSELELNGLSQALKELRSGVCTLNSQTASFEKMGPSGAEQVVLFKKTEIDRTEHDDLPYQRPKLRRPPSKYDAKNYHQYLQRRTGWGGRRP